MSLVKEVINDSGGTAVPANWQLTATPVAPVAPGLVPVTVTGSAVGTPFEVRPGQAYQLSEAGPAGYTPVSIVCTVENLAPRLTTTITLNGNELAVCVFLNDDQPGQLTLVKEVDNGTTGATATATDWTLSASGPTPISGTSGSVTVTDAEVNAGTYTLAESGGPIGYQPSAWSCTGATASGATVTVPSGGDVTCTITNTAIPPRLTLVKVVDNGTTGGTAVADRLDLVRVGPDLDQRSVRHGSRDECRSSCRHVHPGRDRGPGRLYAVGVDVCWCDGGERFDPADHGSGGDVHDHEYGGCADVDVGEGGDEQRWWFGGADGLVVVGCGWGDDPGSCG